MEAGHLLALAGSGYLFGSISFARLVARLVAPATDLTRSETTVDGETYVTDSVSATAVREKLGMRWGILTGLLDMAKAAVPILVVGAVAPGSPSQLVVAAAVIVGHDFPLWHRFRGGRGETVLVGSLLVLDPVGLALMTFLGAAIGFAAGSLLLLRFSGFALMAPWLWIVRDDPAATLYLLFALSLLALSFRSELTYYRAVAGRATNEEAAEFEFGSGHRLGRAIDRWSLPALLARTRARSRTRA